MPAFERAELTAELEVWPPDGGSRDPLEAAKTAAAETGLAREAGPRTLVLSGERGRVLDAARGVLDAALEAGAHRVDLRVEAQGEAPRFGRT